jgi:hypothetical protein
MNVDFGREGELINQKWPIIKAYLGKNLHSNYHQRRKTLPRKKSKRLFRKGIKIRSEL